jgi:hypothetical protein
MCSRTLYEFASCSKKGKFYASTIKANPSRGGGAKPTGLSYQERRPGRRKEVYIALIFPRYVSQIELEGAPVRR